MSHMAIFAFRFGSRRARAFRAAIGKIVGTKYGLMTSESATLRRGDKRKVLAAELNEPNAQHHLAPFAIGVVVRSWQAGPAFEKLRSKIMKIAKVLAPSALLAALFCAWAGAEESKTNDVAQPEGVPAKEFQSKAAYCETCHGLSARGFIGTNPMPRLAGQPPAYVKNQLQAFIERRRLNPVMGNVAHVLSPAMVDALAVHFKNLDPPPYGGAPKDLVSDGEKIYHEGVPSADIPACDTCHGQDAHGMEDFPRLAGQLYDYVIDKLTNWPKERGQNSQKPDNSEIMAPFAQKLTKEQIAAVAAYVSDLK